LSGFYPTLNVRADIDNRTSVTA